MSLEAYPTGAPIAARTLIVAFQESVERHRRTLERRLGRDVTVREFEDLCEVVSAEIVDEVRHMIPPTDRRYAHVTAGFLRGAFKRLEQQFASAKPVEFVPAQDTSINKRPVGL